ncbi:helix-turn-helix domain-containing protein, partial [Patescibacteria group bacterium]|nr:helix-turn-helix domain-containing protein [Patescibacteria group bacterium]
MGYAHEKLQESERRRIERLKASGLSLRKIAERL